MADAVLFIGWGNTVRGRERKAMQEFGEAVATWSSLQAEGKIESFEGFFLEPHGGDLNGFFLLRGDAEQLDGARRDEAFGRMISRAGLIVENLGVVSGWTGAGIERQMATFAAAIEDLT